jgi:hypothetical protein
VIRCGTDRSILCFLAESNIADPLSEPLSGDAGQPSRRDESREPRVGWRRQRPTYEYQSPVVSQPPRLGMSPRRYRGGRPRRRGNARWASTTCGRSAGLTVSSPDIPACVDRSPERSLVELGDAIGKPRLRARC